MNSSTESNTKIEFERKFLVKFLPNPLGEERRVEIEQGFLAYSPLEVRLRQVNRIQFTMTVKGEGRQAFRTETEVNLDNEQFSSLWPLTSGRRILKTRHMIPYMGETIELDVFHGSNNGLIIAEVEFLSEVELEGFHTPDWFGEEITGSNLYHNPRLARD